MQTDQILGNEVHLLFISCCLHPELRKAFFRLRQGFIQRLQIPLQRLDAVIFLFLGSIAFLKMSAALFLLGFQQLPLLSNPRTLQSDLILRRLCLFHPAGQILHLLVERRKIEFIFLHQAGYGRDLIPEPVPPGMVLLDPIALLLNLFLHPGQLFLRVVDLSAPSQKVAVVLKRASGHRSAGTEQLAVQGDQPQAVTVAACDLHCPVYVFHDNGTAEQIAYQIAEPVFTGHDLRSKPDHAELLEDALFLQLTAVFHGSQRQEGGTPEPVFLQKRDHALCRLLIGCHDILDASAKRCLDGQLILLRGLDQIRHDPQNPGNTVLLLHDPPDRAAVPLITLRDRAQGIKPGGFPLIGLAHFRKKV